VCIDQSVETLVAVQQVACSNCVNLPLVKVLVHNEYSELGLIRFH